MKHAIFNDLEGYLPTAGLFQWFLPCNAITAQNMLSSFDSDIVTMEG